MAKRRRAGIDNQTSNKTAQSPSPQPQQLDAWSALHRGHDRCVRLGEFFDIARQPTVSDVEIAVAFCDIRSFTDYCNKLQHRSLDNRIQNFLKDFLGIFSISVLEIIWGLEPHDAREELSYQGTQIRDALVPATYKNLGDGLMLVWEIPPHADIEVQGRITHHIFDTIMIIYRNFTTLFTNPGPVEVDAYSDEVKDLRLGFGVARGHAWKLNFGHHLKPDYAGSIVNLAARLQDKARPEGIVCQYHFSQTLFEGMEKAGHGTVEQFDALKGLDPVKVISFDGDHVASIMAHLATGHSVSTNLGPGGATASHRRTGPGRSPKSSGSGGTLRQMPRGRPR